jgi:hypothetical protein
MRIISMRMIRMRMISIPEQLLCLLFLNRFKRGIVAGLGHLIHFEDEPHQML